MNQLCRILACFLLLFGLIMCSLYAESTQDIFSRANTHIEKGELDQAIAEYDKVAVMLPNDSAVYYNRGQAYFRKGDYNKAINDFTKSLAIKPHYSTYYNRGLAHWNNGSPKQAIVDYTSAIEMQPSNSNAYCNRGVVYFENRMTEQAISDFNKALDINPRDAIAYNGRSHAYYSLGKIDLALEDANKAISLGYHVDPGFMARLKEAALFRPEVGQRELTINIMNRVYRIQGNTNCSQQLIRDMLPGITGLTDADAKEFLIKTEFIKWGEAGRYWEEEWTLETTKKTGKFMLTLTPTPDGGADYKIQQK